MASGFITLPNGKDWSARWSGYDLVLKTIMSVLSEEGIEGHLRKWLTYILPNENNGDVESGYCFYKKVGDNKDDFESILRIIDTRLMKKEFQTIFWNSVEKAHLQLNIESYESFLMTQLYHSYINSLQESEVPPNDLDLKEIFLLNGFEITA